MSKRQRRRRTERRREAQRRIPARRQVIAGAGVAMGATLAATGSAQAAQFTVSNLSDSGTGSLRQAIKDANSNPGTDDVVFASGLTGTIEVGSISGLGLYIESAMNIQGNGQITLHGGNPIDYVVYTGSAGGSYGANPGDPVAISGLTITGGDADGSISAYSTGGGIFNKDLKLSLSKVVV